VQGSAHRYRPRATRASTFLPTFSVMRQPAFLSVAASLDLDSIGLHPITTVTMAIAIGTVTIASRPNPVVATDQCWSAAVSTFWSII
jgi:hypothetical protein